MADRDRTQHDPGCVCDRCQRARGEWIGLPEDGPYVEHLHRPPADRTTQAAAALFIDAYIPPVGNRTHFEAQVASVVEGLLALLAEKEAQVRTLTETAQALYERVEMDESVGICLSSRAEALALGSTLAALSARLHGGE